MPERIQRSRKKGWRKPEGAVVVSRPSGWGNPFVVGEPFRFVDTDGQVLMGVTGSREAAVALFRRFLAARPDLQAKVRAELAGRDLCCWCPLPGPDEPDVCHAAVLLSIANPSMATTREDTHA